MPGRPDAGGAAGPVVTGDGIQRSRPRPAVCLLQAGSRLSGRRGPRPDAPGNPRLVFCRPVGRLGDFSAQRGVARLLQRLKTMQEGTSHGSRSYVGGSTDTVPHGIAGMLAAGQIAAGQDALSVAVVGPDAGSLATSQWSPAVTAARSPARQRAWRSAPARSPSGCRAAERASRPCAVSTARVSAGGSLTPSSRITGHRQISLYSAGDGLRRWLWLLWYSVRIGQLTAPAAGRAWCSGRAACSARPG
jgi:hypothetical protein